MEFNYLSGYENKDSNYSKTNYYKIIIGLFYASLYSLG